MDTDSLTHFVNAVACGSFTGAADQAGVDPSAVSRAIASLERQLGFRLFERSTRRIELTEAGAAYHDRVAPILQDLDTAAAAARDLVERPQGVLRVSASTAFGEAVIVPMLAAFRADTPDVTVELHLSDAQVDLIAERIDLAVRLTPEAPPDMLTRRLMPTCYRVVAAPGWGAAHDGLTPAALSNVDCLVFPYDGFRDRWLFRKRDGPVTEVAVRGPVQIAGAAALAAAARSGLGPALLADWLISTDLVSGRLVDLFPDYQVAATAFDTAAHILTPSRAYTPLKTRRFIAALRANVRNPAIRAS